MKTETRGRPKLPKTVRKYRNFNARVDAGTYETLKVKAASQGKTMSRLATEILNNALRGTDWIT